MPRRLAPGPAHATASRRSSCEAVTYTYPGGTRPALDRVSLSLEKGEQLGVVGLTGAGKSTLAAMILGLLYPDEGRVLIDGAPLEDFDAQQLHRHTAWVAQEPVLLTASVAENIRFFRDGFAADDDPRGRPRRWSFQGDRGVARGLAAARRSGGQQRSRSASANAWRWRGRSWAILT